MWILYQLIYAVLLLLAGPILLLRRGRHYLDSLPARLGLRRAPATAEPPLWIHAVSVGEVGVATTLASRLDGPLLVTTVTPTGQKQARRHLGARGAVDYLPFELGWVVRSFLEHHRPRALLLAEGDYWPLVLRQVERQRLPVAVFNARVGDRSFRRLKRLARWIEPLLRSIDAFAVQTEEDRRRLLELGVDSERIAVTGNLKFEAPEPPTLPELESRLRRLADGRAILVAGSTMNGEEEAVLDAFRAAGGGERALLVLAPRHPERWPAVHDEIERRGESLVRRSDLPSVDRAPQRPAAICLLDSMGELASVYRVATAAFIGGTLVETGGHNPLEPARFGVPTAVGPSMENFRSMAAEFDRRGAWRRVEDASALGAVWRHWIDDPADAASTGAAAAALIEENRGALDRTLALLAPVLARAPDEGGGGPHLGEAGGERRG